MNEQDNIMILCDEEGNQIEYEFLGMIDYNSKEYVVLLPVDENACDVLILEVEHSEEFETSYVTVADEKILQAVFDIFKEKFKDEFNFID